jgi:3-carboxy-cis,cis-muconate cycloisomerase
LPPGDAEPGGLFGPIFTTDELAEATSDRAWVASMLEFEAALAVAEAEVGLVPPEAAAAIGQVCRQTEVNPAALGRGGRLGASPVIPLVAGLRQQLPPDAARWAHFGATSQDVLDSALMLVLRRVLDLTLVDLARLAKGAAALAGQHRSTLSTARTLLQHAAPTTFGRKAAGWLVAIVEVGEVLRHVRQHRLAVQLGGPAGTLAALGRLGPDVVEALASQLGLEVPVLPWHTDRTRVVEISSALTLAAGVAGKTALDVSLLMQTEVSEVFEPGAAGRGASSSLPHKRNPSMAAEILAAARRAQALTGVVLAGMAQEHERAVGAWQAEWQTVSELSRAAGGAVSFCADMLTGLEVDPARMATNMGITRGLLLAERLTLELAPFLGYDEARRQVEAASKRVALSASSLEEALSLEDALSREPGVAEVLSRLPPDAFDPAAWTGSSELFVDRAIELYRKAYGDG